MANEEKSTPLKYSLKLLLFLHHFRSDALTGCLRSRTTLNFSTPFLESLPALEYIM